MDDLETYVRKVVLENAVKYDGKPNAKSVMGAIMGSRADLRSKAGEIKPLVEKFVEEVEKLPLDAQRSQLLEIDPTALDEDVTEKTEKKELSDLPNLDKWNNQIVMRLAPFPSGPLHIGNSRMVILNDYYVKRYNGKLILVFDDTIGSAEKQVETEAFDLIPEGLDYLGVEVHETVYKSDRMDLFYKYAVDLIEKGHAYVCDCDANEWRTKHKVVGKACSCRNLSVEDNVARWEKMLDGSYPEKAAALRMKTGMDDPDPAMRDHVALRISETDHPRVGSKYRVWPLLEYSWGIDDHELGVTHIIRGKDLVKEGKIEQYIWNLYGWKHPELIYYGRLKFQDATLSKSKSRQEVVSGVYSGWDDPRTWSLQSLEKRGIHPDALRKAMLDLGLSIVDISISMKSVYSENRKIRDADAPRFFFVQNPVWVKSIGLPDDLTSTEAPVHPDFPDRGVRKIPLVQGDSGLELGIPDHDFQKIDDSGLFRMKDLANFVLKKGKTPSVEYHSLDVEEVRKVGGSIIHWIPKENSVPIELTLIDGSIAKGLAEPSIEKSSVGTFIQFERVGFARIFDVDEGFKVSFAHK
ncbi:MAG: glutamate--tRNA ligase [Candidatus Thorarchaeota archaeon]